MINVVGLSILGEIKAQNGLYCDVRTLVLPELSLRVKDLINRRFFNVYFILRCIIVESIGEELVDRFILGNTC